MVPTVSAEDAFRYYACVGGVPYYLAQIDESRPFLDNIADLFFSTDGLLYEEPLMLLRQELREPAVYNSILRAIGSGATRRGEIAARAGLEATAVSKYLATLERLDIIERVVPFWREPSNFAQRTLPFRRCLLRLLVYLCHAGSWRHRGRCRSYCR